MRRSSNQRVRGIVSGSGLAARDCQLLHATTDAHSKLRVRMRREDVALELSNHADSEPNAARVYSVLVSTGKNNVWLLLHKHDEITVQLPVLVAGRLELAEVTFSVQQVRAVVAGLRSSELVHPTIVQVAATSD